MAGAGLEWVCPSLPPGLTDGEEMQGPSNPNRFRGGQNRPPLPPRAPPLVRPCGGIEPAAAVPQEEDRGNSVCNEPAGRLPAGAQMSRRGGSGRERAGRNVAVHRRESLRVGWGSGFGKGFIEIDGE